MSEPIFSINEQIVINGDMSGDVTSDAQEIKEVKGYAIQAIWSAGSTPVGSTKLQASLDGTNYTDIDGSSISVSGNSGSNFYNIELANYPYVRLVYTRTSGSGTLNVSISAKRS